MSELETRRIRLKTTTPVGTGTIGHVTLQDTRYHRHNIATRGGSGCRRSIPSPDCRLSTRLPTQRYANRNAFSYTLRNTACFTTTATRQSSDSAEHVYDIWYKTKVNVANIFNRNLNQFQRRLVDSTET